MKFGEKIKQMRQQRELTQPELSELIGIEQSYLSKLENDKSVPSGDILHQVLEVFEVSLEDFVASLSQAYVKRHLKAIPEIADLLASQQINTAKSQKRWVLASACSCVFGLTALLSGHFNLFFPNIAYQYESKGVVLDGEPLDIFSMWERHYRELRSDVFDGKRRREIENETLAKRREMYNRLDQKYLVTYDYRGEVFNEKVSGGSRTFKLSPYRKGPKYINRPEKRFIVALGTFLFIAGVFGFIVERRLHR